MDKKFDAICLGTCLLDISTSGLDFNTFLETEPNLAESITYSAGGDAVNEAMAMSKLGNRVGLISRVGDDFIGRFLLEQAEAAGVDVASVYRDPDAPTAANNILIGAKDKRIYTISKNKTSRTEFCEDDVDYEVIRRARLIAFGSIFVHEKFDDRALTHLFQTAKQNGAITCADVGPTAGHCSLDGLRHALPYLDYLFPNEREAAMLSGKRDPDEMADYFLNLGIGTVAIKFGAKGSLIKNKKTRFFQQPFYVDPIDTTGAGDCYAAGFMSGLIHGLPLEACAAYASATGALAVGRVGATAGIESAKQVEAFLESRNKRMNITPCV